MGYVIEFAYATDIPTSDIQALYTAEWQRPTALSDLDFFEWQFTTPLACQGKNYCCLATLDSELVGVAGVTPRHFLIGNESVLCGEVTTWLLTPQHRGGLGAMMMRFLQSQFEVLLGTGANQAALNIDLRLGYSPYFIPRYVTIFNWEAVKPYTRYTPLAHKLHHQHLRDIARGDTLNWDIEKLEQDNLKPVVDDFRKTHCFSSRYFEDITWRYTNHPIFDYHTAVVHSHDKNSTGAFLAYRIDRSIAGMSMVHITDLFGDISSVQAAIRHVQRVALAQNIDAADFYCTSSLIGSCFRRANWFSLLDCQFFSFPHLFHPIEWRDPPTGSLVYWSKNNLLQLHDLGRTYITKQDVDLDRPVLTIN